MMINEEYEENKRLKTEIIALKEEIQRNKTIMIEVNKQDTKKTRDAFRRCLAERKFYSGVTPHFIHFCLQQNMAALSSEIVTLSNIMKDHESGRQNVDRISRKQPADGFAKEHMSELYAECNELAKNKPANVVTELYEAQPGDYIQTHDLYNITETREKLLDFISHLGVETKQIVSSGMNHTNFDFPFLAAKGLLSQSDFHYRSLEINSVLMYATQTMLNKEGAQRTPKEVQTDAGNCSDYKEWVPELFSDDLVWKNHRALSDCYWQLRVLNGLAWFLRSAKP